MPVGGLSLLSPITTPCRVVAQAVNYRSHARESGFGEEPPAVFFRKSSGSISGPTDDIVRPAHVRLLDYEIELGLVIRSGPTPGTAVPDADLPDHIAGLVMCNDVSARDVQLTKGQFYESKSYPTFTPTGPRLVLLEAGDFARLFGLRLRLWVNGELRCPCWPGSSGSTRATWCSPARQAGPPFRHPRRSSPRWATCSCRPR